MAYELYRVNVDYSKPLAETIGLGSVISGDKTIKRGYYDWVNPDIYRVSVGNRKSGELEIHLVRFNKELTSRQARRLLRILKLRPAELVELSALETQHSGKLKGRFIVGLGSGRRLCGLLLRCPVVRDRACGGRVERALSLFPAGLFFGEPWLETDWFAAVRM